MNAIKKLTNWFGNEKGVTIIEVLMAICILAVGILAVVAMQTASARGGSTSSSSTGGLICAVDRIERLMDLAWDDPALNFANNPQSVTQGKYTITWNVIDDDVISNTKTINMTVIWMSWGLQKRISVQHVIPRII